MFNPGKKAVVFLSGAMLLAALILNNTIGRSYDRYTELAIVVMLAGTVVAGSGVLKTALLGLRYKIIGIDLLVSIAAIGAIFLGEFWEAQAVTFLFTFGDYLESLTLEKTRNSIRSLMDLAPDTARVRRNDDDLEISPDDIVRGDLVVIKAGEKIAVDGEVIEGSAYVNQSAITGESMPLACDPGDRVFTGSILESGYLIVLAEEVGEDTSFARILQMVEEAQDKKARSQKFLEKFAGFYTPAIIAVSIIVGLISKDLKLALTLLVVSCPGALVISTPISYVAAIGNGARNGVLVKGGEVLEKMSRVRAIAFDKTGTLTEGKPAVVRLKAYDLKEDELLWIAAIGEAYSEHPLGVAVIAEAERRFGNINDRPGDVNILIGRGLTFYYLETQYCLGNRKLLDDYHIYYSHAEEYLRQEEELGHTAIMLASGSKLHGIISIADILRPEAGDLIEDLHRQGMKSVVMLSGDNYRTAQAVADELNLDSQYSELLPEDKVKALAELSKRYGEVAMVGDGVNDAPALAAADLGIAIGAVGSDVAMETADVVLLSDDISRLSYAIALSHATNRNVKQNLIFAIIVVLLLLLGVLVKTVNMSLGMLVHEGSVLLVILNAMRLLRYGKRGQKRSA